MRRIFSHDGLRLRVQSGHESRSIGAELSVVVESNVENVLGCGVFAVPVVCPISKCGSGTVPNAAACQSRSADYESVSLGWTAVEISYFISTECVCFYTVRNYDRAGGNRDNGTAVSTM